MIGRPRRMLEIGTVFGRLTVIGLGRRKEGAQLQWECRCSCGGTAFAGIADLELGKVRSCGCLRREVVSAKNMTHGHTSIFRDESGKRSKVYQIWKSMIKRCHTPTDKGYEGYGGRGISVCDRWRESFQNFLADMGEPPHGMSIDRENNDGNYEPGNCRWETITTQNNNTRANTILDTPNGQLTMSQFAKLHSLKYMRLRDAVARGEAMIDGIPIKVLRFGCKSKRAAEQALRATEQREAA